MQNILIRFSLTHYVKFFILVTLTFKNTFSEYWHLLRPVGKTSTVSSGCPVQRALIHWDWTLPCSSLDEALRNLIQGMMFLSTVGGWN